MPDLVVTVPKPLWRDWIAEGDAAGEPETGEEWGFYVHGRPSIKRGERLYIAAWGCVRGYAPVTRVAQAEPGYWAICREGGAVAMTINETVVHDAALGLPCPWGPCGAGPGRFCVTRDGRTTARLHSKRLELAFTSGAVKVREGR